MYQQTEDYQETGRFLSIMIDQARTTAKRNWDMIKNKHHAIAGAYLRYAEDE